MFTKNKLKQLAKKDLRRFNNQSALDAIIEDNYVDKKANKTFMQKHMSIAIGALSILLICAIVVGGFFTYNGLSGKNDDYYFGGATTNEHTTLCNISKKFPELDINKEFAYNLVSATYTEPAHILQGYHLMYDNEETFDKIDIMMFLYKSEIDYSKVYLESVEISGTTMYYSQSYDADSDGGIYFYNARGYIPFEDRHILIEYSGISFDEFSSNFLNLFGQIVR